MERAFPTTEKTETDQTKRGRLLMDQKDIKDLEMIEKEEVPEGKQANAALDSLKTNESSSSAISKTEKMAADTEQGTYTHNSASENVRKGTGNKASPQVSTSKCVQKIWTCDICQLTMYGSNLKSHLQGKKHKAAYEALNTKTKGIARTDTGNGASPHVSAYKKVQKTWTCDICQVTTLSYPAFNSPLYGKKHKAAREALYTKVEGTEGTDTGNGASPHVSAPTNVHKTWTCDICQLTMLEGDMNSHLPGKKHKAASEAINTKTEGTAGTEAGNGASSHVSASTNVNKTWTCHTCQLTMLQGNMNFHLQGKKHKATCEALKVKSQLVA